MSGASNPQPLRSALKTDDDGDRTPPASGSLKAVQIQEPVPEYRPLEEDTQTIKQFRRHSRRLSGRLPDTQPTNSSRSSIYGEASSADDLVQHRHHQYFSEKLLSQVGEWLEREKKKAAGRKVRKITRRRKSNSPPAAQDQAECSQNGHKRADSIDSQSSDVSLDTLQKIVEDSMASMGIGSIPHFTPKIFRSRHRKRASFYRTASSDTDFVDGDVIVPDCDVWIDNSKTLSYGNGNATPDENSAPKQRERDAWLTFKNEIIRTAHTLRLKGWRRVSLESGDDIDVQRLSGALTNAVYVVTPPKDMPELEGKKQPPELLLRIYGPQVEHLIDRDNELKVLQRLARKKIGPRLLGTFKNGRFEEFFHASPLTPKDLRDPDVSKQIAKRMRELHDGIDLLHHEREAGPGVWKNWDQWQDNVGRIISFLDKQVESSSNGALRRDCSMHAWKAHGYVCGVPWPFFRDTVAKYRAYLTSLYNNQQTINYNMVFAHNDTQYGNILRFQPDDEKSPLLQPANKHKQLIVIDFEYAGPNIPGLEFANHFSEWTYNYHDPQLSHICNVTRYPNVTEQRRFLKAYVDHRPQFPHASSTPRLSPLDSSSSQKSGSTPKLLATNSSSSIVDFMLDSRAPPGGWTAAERAREEATDKKVGQLLEETKLWRPANSAMWVAWGIVQAKVPGLDAEGKKMIKDEQKEQNEEKEDEEEEEDEEGGEFDYLSYAQDRALFFWGDVVQLGLVKVEELPDALRTRMKIVEC